MKILFLPNLTTCSCDLVGTAVALSAGFHITIRRENEE